MIDHKIKITISTTVKTIAIRLLIDMNHLILLFILLGNEELEFIIVRGPLWGNNIWNNRNVDNKIILM